MKKVEIKINFTNEDTLKIGAAEDRIIAAFTEVNVEIIKLRYTYVESQYGLADMPPSLILASFLTDMKDCRGFAHILPNLSGTYTFEFRK